MTYRMDVRENTRMGKTVDRIDEPPLDDQRNEHHNVTAELSARIAHRLKVVNLSERKASLKAGLGPDGIRNIRRGRMPRASTLAQLAPVLQCDVNYLSEALPREIILEGDPDFDEGMDEPPIEAPPGYVLVPTLNVHAGLGGGGFSDGEMTGPPRLMPWTLIVDELHGSSGDFVLMPVIGQSMEPILHDGDNVLVDRRKTNPSQPGIFAIWDGYGLVAKWIERVPKSDPPALRIFSENARFAPYESLVEQTRIIGRVVWFARRL